MSAQARKRRVMICDDSRAYGEALARFLEHDGAIEVVGIAVTSEEAVHNARRLRPDLVTMDLEMSVATIEEIMRHRPVPILVVSDQLGRSWELADEALAAGALELLPKGRLHLDSTDDLWATAIRGRIKRLATIRVRRDASSNGNARAAGANGDGAADVSVASLPRSTARVIGIAASTGGPSALSDVLAALDAGFPIPVLVAQHIVPSFLEGLVRWLDERIPLPVRIAENGRPAGPGVWFAADDADIGVDPSMRFRLARSRSGDGHRTSADTLLSSLAVGAGREAVGVVLTGMGKDGASGILEIRAAGGLTVAQDEASSSVFGMPRAAAEAGAQVVLSLGRIGPALNTLRKARQ